MSTEKLTKLETFIEHHRPDFDAHEPGPELWARLEAQLGQPGPGVGPVLLAEEAGKPESALAIFPRAAAVAALPTLPTASKPASDEVPAARRPWARYGVAAALAALVMAAMLSEVHRPAPAAGLAVAAPGPDDTLDRSAPVDAATFGPIPQALAASERLIAPDPRLSTAVRGMETYYAGQLSSRQTELRQLDAQNPAADWPRELDALDSSYRQLKEELPHHPQPEVVLTAMNRNLQIRLDILDQQLEHRAASPESSSVPSGTMVSLADSRPQP